ncbi:hypothetical protein FOMPIDRAFT_1025286, partial [Fomitopsis schrenkii]
ICRGIPSQMRPDGRKSLVVAGVEYGRMLRANDRTVDGRILGPSPSSATRHVGRPPLLDTPGGGCLNVGGGTTLRPSSKPTLISG